MLEISCHGSIIFLFLKIDIVLANSVDPDRISLTATFLLGLHCLSKYPFISKRMLPPHTISEPRYVRVVSELLYDAKMCPSHVLFTNVSLPKLLVPQITERLRWFTIKYEENFERSIGTFSTTHILAND